MIQGNYDQIIKLLSESSKLPVEEVERRIEAKRAKLSGLISKLDPESAHFKTPTASIGIRGTKFVVKVEGE